MLEDILQGKKALFETGVSTELRAHENRQRRAVFVGGNLMGNVRVETSGISARVCKNGVYGFASAASYTSEMADNVLKAATKNALFMNNHAGKGGKNFSLQTPGYVELKKVIVDTEQKRIIDKCKEIDAYVAAKYPKLASRTVVYSEDSMDKILYTSDAKDGHITSPRAYIYVIMNATTPAGQPVELFKAFGGFGSFDDNFSDISFMYEEIESLYQSVMKKAEGVYAEAGYKTVILDGLMSGMLSHEAVGHTVEADLVRGGSVAGPSLNKQVASPLVSLTDFAHTAFGKQVPLPVYLDDEGTEAQDAVIIKDGMLTGYMHNRETADFFGVAPTGNARGWSFSDEPIIRMRNTTIHPGKNSIEEMIESIDDGYYLVSSTNGQADLTGEFMFGVSEGYEIKNGKLGRAILDTTVSGVAFEMLKTVDMVGNKIVWSSSGFCGKKQPMAVSMGGPAIRCKLTIGGR